MSSENIFPNTKLLLAEHYNIMESDLENVLESYRTLFLIYYSLQI
jgi:hypothetical protein